MKRKKISIFNISLASGGAEKVISLLLKKLVVDYDVTLILVYDLIHFEIPKEVDLIILANDSSTKHFTFFRQFSNFVKYTLKYLRILKRKEIDIAISFLAYPNFLNSIAKMRFSKLKTIISERGFPSDNTTTKTSFYISKIIYPLLYNRNDKLFSNSIYINRDLQENFNVKIPMGVIYNPIQMPRQKVDFNKTSNMPLEFRIVNVGTLNSRKNQSMIIKAIGLLKNGYQLDIIGMGPLIHNLESLILKNNLKDKINLKGTVKNVYEHLISYDCFVLSSNTEGFPNALLEAMAIGLPCISTNCLSGPLELLNGSADEIRIESGNFFEAKYGLLVNTDDAIGLSKAISFIKENKLLSKKYSVSAAERARQFDLSVIYNQFVDFINS